MTDGGVADRLSRHRRLVVPGEDLDPGGDVGGRGRVERGRRGRTAEAMSDWGPAVAPSVHWVAERPLASVVVDAGETDPLPGVGVQATLRPLTPLPCPSTSRTTSDSATKNTGRRRLVVSQDLEQRGRAAGQRGMGEGDGRAPEPRRAGGCPLGAGVRSQRPLGGGLPVGPGGHRRGTHRTAARAGAQLTRVPPTALPNRSVTLTTSESVSAELTLADWLFPRTRKWCRPRPARRRQ